MSITLAQIQDLTNHLDALRAKYLRQQGWKESSSHPDFCWRWTKTIARKTYHLSLSDALDMERAISTEGEP